jgi:hypothetical protein
MPETSGQWTTLTDMLPQLRQAQTTPDMGHSWPWVDAGHSRLLLFGLYLIGPSTYTVHRSTVLFCVDVIMFGWGDYSRARWLHGTGRVNNNKVMD